MSLVEIVHASVVQQMGDIAGVIEGELKGACPVRSGEARDAIHQEQVSEFVIRIGGINDHLYFADQGNGHRIIYPVKAKALHFSDGSFHNRANPYPGKHFVRAVANRHR